MTDERINRALAEFMGWQWIDYLHIKDENGNWIFDGSLFDPRNDANHALMVLEKWRVPNNYDKPYVEIELNNGVWNIVLHHKIRNRTHTEYKVVAEATNKSLNNAIVLAVLQAVDGKQYQIED